MWARRARGVPPIKRDVPRNLDTAARVGTQWHTEQRRQRSRILPNSCESLSER
jgi:hypothetical protein